MIGRIARFIGVVLIVAVAWWMYWSFAEHRTPKDVGRVLDEGRRVTAVVLLPDKDESLRSAAVISYEPLSGNLFIYHVPISICLEKSLEDSLSISNRGSMPLTLESAYAKNSFEEIHRRLQMLFGPDLTFTAVLPMSHFLRLIDLMGGIFVDVPARISFRSSPTGAFDRFSDWVEIPQGEEIFFDSDKTQMYLSYRFDGLGLRGQLFRGKRLAVAVLRRLKQHLSYDWFRHELVLSFTHISSPSILKLFTAMTDVPVSSLDVKSIPGQSDINGAVYWLSYREFVSSLPKELKPLIQASAPKSRITVQLLNGSGAPNVAARIREQLDEYPDIDIVEMGNADRRDYEVTQIVDRAGYLRSAERVRELVNAGVLRQDINPKWMVDVTVIIGRDIR